MTFCPKITISQFLLKKKYRKKANKKCHNGINCCQPEQLTFWIAVSISEEMRRGRTLVLHL